MSVKGNAVRNWRVPFRYGMMLSVRGGSRITDAVITGRTLCPGFLGTLIDCSIFCFNYVDFQKINRMHRSSGDENQIEAGKDDILPAFRLFRHILGQVDTQRLVQPDGALYGHLAICAGYIPHLQKDSLIEHADRRQRPAFCQRFPFGL